MSLILIYGHSDDLVEVRGAVNEEFLTHGEECVLTFDDGRMFSCEYGKNGVWKFRCLNPDEGFGSVDNSSVDVLPPDELIENTNEYSEVVVYDSYTEVTGVEETGG